MGMTHRTTKRERKVLDFSCGDPYYNLRNENKSVYGDQMKSNIKIGNAVDSLGQFPKLKKQVLESL